MILALYLKGVSTEVFTDALVAILGEKAAGLSATNLSKNDEFKVQTSEALIDLAAIRVMLNGSPRGETSQTPSQGSKPSRRARLTRRTSRNKEDGGP